jgi:glucose-1-phosphate thymidylyltransferase
LPELQPSARGEYEITDAIQMLVDRGELVLAGVYEGEWFDTGTLPSFLETTRFLTRGEARLAEDALIEGTVSGSVVIGAGSQVRCASIEDSVVMPGSEIRVSGAIRGCVLAGRVEVEGDLTDAIRDGALDA